MKKQDFFSSTRFLRGIAMIRQSFLPNFHPEKHMQSRKNVVITVSTLVEQLWKQHTAIF